MAKKTETRNNEESRRKDVGEQKTIDKAPLRPGGILRNESDSATQHTEKAALLIEDAERIKGLYIDILGSFLESDGKLYDRITERFVIP